MLPTPLSTNGCFPTPPEHRQQRSQGVGGGVPRWSKGVRPGGQGEVEERQRRISEEKVDKWEENKRENEKEGVEGEWNEWMKSNLWTRVNVIGFVIEMFIVQYYYSLSNSLIFQR